MERMDTYYGQKFGSDWKDKDKEFWKNFTWYT
jgi:hypothetical protein